MNVVLYDENEDRGKQLHESLLGHIPGVLAHRVRSGGEAQRVIQSEVVNVILVSCATGEGAHQVERARAWATDIPVIAYEASAQIERATALVAMAVDGDDPASLSSLIRDVVKLRPPARAANGMRTFSAKPSDSGQVRAALLRVNHDINNPLSIISGNAQLLLELARATGLDEDFKQPMRDIEEASRRASFLLHRLIDLAAQVGPPAPDTPQRVEQG